MHKILFLLIIWIWSSSAHAIKFHETVNDWDIYSMKQNGKLICYTVSQPIEKSIQDKDRETYIVVTKIGKNLYEFNAAISKQLLKDQTFIEIQGKRMNLFTKENLAWTKNNESDQQLINLMKAGDRLKLFWNSKNKKNNLDQYSLQGFSKALKQIDQLCQH